MKDQNTDKIVGFAVALVLMLAMGSGFVRSLDIAVYNLGLRVTPVRPPSDEIVVIAIDDASLDTLGPWPWNRESLARMTRLLSKANASVIAPYLALENRQNELGLAALNKLKNQNNSGNDEQAGTLLLNRAIQKLNTDQTLARSFTGAGNVILSVPFTSSQIPLSSLPEIPGTIARHTVDTIRGEQPAIYKHIPEWLHPEHAVYIENLITPVNELGSGAAGLGLGIGKPVSGEDISARPIVFPYGDQFLPSFALQVVAAKTGNQDKIQIIHGNGVTYGDRVIPTDTKFRTLPFFYKAKNNIPPFKVYSFAKVLSGEIQPSTFSDKVVLIGPTSSKLTNKYPTPLNIMMPPVLIEAHTISSLLQKDLFNQPTWSYWFRYLALILVGFYLAYFLPRLNTGTGIAVTSLFLVILFNIHFVTMAFLFSWIPLMGAISALVLGNMLLGFKNLVLQRIKFYQQELSNSNRLLGQAYHTQGQFDLAFEKYRGCKMDEELLSLTYNLGLDYERKRQFNKAVNVFRFIRSHKSDYRDAKDRVRKNLQTSNAVVLGKPGTNAESTLVIAKDGVQKPMLGRYQIEGELGRGAMGTVYLGNDPKIGRTVAIKTMPLSAEFEEDKLEEVKQRFFREAKTAGRLNHYNIVTIYDVGEDQDLAYIAMDYLQGVDMSKYAKKENLLKVSDLFNIMIQVTDALNYAHNQNVVHRDIKPANIIYDRRTKKPTITDFGVAHIADASKTKTGTILGTPSFMSPEQLAGETVDGRSDLFSLAVTFFQLLTGELPFASESISTLMYKIANEEPVDILQIRPALPVCVKAVINKAMFKDADKRFQTGAEFAMALRKCQQNIIAQQLQNTNGRKTPSF